MIGRDVSVARDRQRAVSGTSKEMGEIDSVDTADLRQRWERRNA